MYLMNAIWYDILTMALPNLCFVLTTTFLLYADYPTYHWIICSQGRIIFLKLHKRFLSDISYIYIYDIAWMYHLR